MGPEPIRLAARRVLRPDGSVRPGVVAIDGTVITAVVEADGPTPDRTIAPGLVDLQVNGLDGVDVATATDEELLHLDRRLAAAGTTSWCPTLTSRPLPWYAAWFASHPRPPAGELGIHLEGPFITRAGAHRADALRPPDRAWLGDLPRRVRLVTLAPELPGGLAAIEVLAARALVALGHSAADHATALEAARRGARLVTHVFNAMPALHHREPGLIGAALGREGLIPSVIGDGVHVHPSVLRLVLMSGPAVLVSDSVAFARPGLSVIGGAARLPDGTIAGSVITLADAIGIATAAGVPLAVALVAATRTPALLMHRTDIGTLAPGARADLTIWGPDQRLDATWRHGRLVSSPGAAD